MERTSPISGRWALGLVIIIGLTAALPATASAGNGNGRNGPPGPAGNPHPPAHAGNPHGQPPARGAQPHHATPAPRANAVRAHGTPPAHHVAPAPAAPAPRSHPATPRPATATQTHTNNGAAHQKTTICHATGSATNPYVQITISDRALKAHSRHQDGRDIIPAPAGGCPQTAAQVAAATTKPAPLGAAAMRAAKRIVHATQPSHAKRGASRVLSATQTAAAPQSQAAGAEDSSASAATAASPAADTVSTHGGGSSLPFTGLELALALIVAAALLLAGFALRRAASVRTRA